MKANISRFPMGCGNGAEFPTKMLLELDFLVHCKLLKKLSSNFAEAECM